MADDTFRVALRDRIATYVRAEAQAQARLQALEKEVERLRQRREASETLYEAEFGEKPIDASSPTEPSLFPAEEARSAGNGVLSGLRWEEAIERVLRDAGRPLHVRDIWDGLEAGGFQTTARDPMRSIVTIAIRSRNVQHVGPRTYALPSS